jgi:hypothetical protein
MQKMSRPPEESGTLKELDGGAKRLDGPTYIAADW